MSKHLATVARKNFLLTGRKPRYRTWLKGGRPSDATGWVEREREERRRRREEEEEEQDRDMEEEERERQTRTWGEGGSTWVQP